MENEKKEMNLKDTAIAILSSIGGVGAMMVASAAVAKLGIKSKNVFHAIAIALGTYGLGSWLGGRAMKAIRVDAEEYLSMLKDIGDVFKQLKDTEPEDQEETPTEDDFETVEA